MIKIEYFFIRQKPVDLIYHGEIPLKSLQTDEPLMNIKLRMAVQASEFYAQNVSVYDFVLAVVTREGF